MYFQTLVKPVQAFTLSAPSPKLDVPAERYQEDFNKQTALKLMEKEQKKKKKKRVTKAQNTTRISQERLS